MKCANCRDERIAFSIVPDISKKIAWSSHVISEKDGVCQLYHYQCANMSLLSVYGIYLDTIDDISR